MAVRAQFENSHEWVVACTTFYIHTDTCEEIDMVVLTGLYRIGVFSCLTNSYAVVAVGASENFYRCVFSSFFPNGKKKKQRGKNGKANGLLMQQYFRSWTPGRHSHLPCYDCRNSDYRSSNCWVRPRQSKRKDWIEKKANKHKVTAMASSSLQRQQIKNCNICEIPSRTMSKSNG